MGEKRVQQELKVLRKNNEKLKIDCNAHIVDNQSLKGTVLARKFKIRSMSKKNFVKNEINQFHGIFLYDTNFHFLKLNFMETFREMDLCINLISRVFFGLDYLKFSGPF